MKKTIKFLAFIFIFFLLIAFCFFGYAIIISSKYNLDEKKLNYEEKSLIKLYDINENEIKNFDDKKYVEYSEINKNTINAFVSIEDKRFFSHKGIDNKAIFRALFNNLKSLSFKQGASTITQQLVKNTHLSNEKTLKRKIIEGKIARQIEKKYSKEKIIEMYLNNIYFGDNCFGIYKASMHYFNKEPKDLTTNESACLAGIVKSPYFYSPTKNSENSFKRKNTVLSEMYKQGYISKDELDFCKTQKVSISQNQSKENKDYMLFLYNELDKILDENNVYNKKFKVYTTVDINYQNIVEKYLYEFSDVSDSASNIVLRKDGGIIAYSSNIGEVKRQVGSIIKPILVYAPAFEYDIINESTIVNDEISNFGGLNIQNYNDKYYGKITAKKALVNSSNTISAKVLNSVGIEKAKSCIKKLPLELTNDDNTLLLSIGSTKKGQTLSNITSCYLPFLNNGYSQECYIIDKVITEDNLVIYKHQPKKQKIFGDDTTYLVNDCLNDCVINGTAKKLKTVSENLCAKTGTVGNENGNMDAYSICYNTDFISSVWLGNEKGELMSNSVTGGTYPSIINRNILSDLYESIERKDFFEMPDSICQVNIDYHSLYDECKEEIILDDIPLTYIQTAIYKKNNIPKSISTRFKNPKIENAKISVNCNGFNVSLYHAQYIDYIIFDEVNNVKKEIYNSKVDGNKDIVQFNKFNDYYIHKISLIPYFNDNFGEEIILGNIKFDPIVDDTWWLD